MIYPMMYMRNSKSCAQVCLRMILNSTYAFLRRYQICPYIGIVIQAFKHLHDTEGALHSGGRSLLCSDPRTGDVPPASAPEAYIDGTHSIPDLPQHLPLHPFRGPDALQGFNPQGPVLHGGASLDCTPASCHSLPACALRCGLV